MDFNSTPHATPAQLRLLELQQEEVKLNAAKVQGFFHFLNFRDSAAFDRCLGRSGKSPECLSRAPDGGPSPRKYANIAAGQSFKARQQEASRSLILVAQRKEPAALTSEETMARLRNVFMSYTDPVLYAHTGRREMNIIGFCRLMRDCRLLDNKLTLVAADVILTRVDAGTDGDGGGPATTPGDMHVDYEEFIRCLRAVVRIKYPKAKDVQKAMLLLARRWILAFARDSGGGGGDGGAVDGLFSRSTMNVLREYDNQLKELFAWYSSMDETDPSRVTWAWAREHSGAINASQFALMLLNFHVLPVLLSKKVALDVYTRCEAANDADERANFMYFPAFLEALAEIALEVGKYAEARVRTVTSPDELKLLCRYADGCPPPHGPRVQQVCQEVMSARGRDSLTLDQHALYNAEGIKRRNEAQMAQAAQQQAKAQTQEVVQRREGLRQRFALTRLKNFYRDVRTFNNNTTWPPERDTSPPTNRSNAVGAAGSGHGGEGVHVAFYDSERAIKTPKPVWMSVSHATGHRVSHFGLDANAQLCATASVATSGPANILMLDSPSGSVVNAVKQSLFFTPVANARRSDVHSGLMPSSGGAYVRSPKPYQYKVAIEDRDEHEAILDLASRLPYIHAPSDDRGETLDEVSRISLQSLGKPRASTAPAEVNRRQSGDRPSPSGNSPKRQAGQEEAGSMRSPQLAVCQEYAAETCVSCCGTRSRLPPVRHQLHRMQATAVALAVLSGQPAPNPYSIVPDASSLRLPPALSTNTLNSGPSVASWSSCICQQGPSSSLRSLGYSPNSSQRFSPGNSLTRKRQGHRKRVDPGGLPNLQLPADSVPSLETAAALRELDRFDNARELEKAWRQG